MAAAGASEPLLRIGVCSDVQYADIPDGVSFHGVPRFYRNALVALRRCVVAWAAAGCSAGIHFGDIVDAAQPRHASEAALDDLLGAFALLGPGKPTRHMLGNHCLYNLPRARLNERLGIPPAPDGGSYYSWSPHPGLRLVVLDAYDVSMLGWGPQHERHLLAERILAERNPNASKNSPEGLVGVERRFVMFGGGVSEAQLTWLAAQLQEAKAASQSVVVCSHLPLLPGTCPPACLLWNYEEVLAVCRDSGVVVASMAGHTHQNGYLVDEAGIHHMVLPAVLETPPGRDAYGWLDLHPDRLHLQGVDTCMTCVCRLDEAAQARMAVHLAGSSSNGSSSGSELQQPAEAGEAAAPDLLVDVAEPAAVAAGAAKAGGAGAADSDALAGELRAVSFSGH